MKFNTNIPDTLYQQSEKFCSSNLLEFYKKGALEKIRRILSELEMFYELLAERKKTRSIFNKIK